MREISLLLIILSVRSLSGAPKIKLRMDFVAAATFVEASVEDKLRELLLLVPETFAFGSQYTRMALIDYRHEVITRFPLLDRDQEVIETIKRIKEDGWEGRSYLCPALQTMLRLSNENGRSNALKVFMVATHKWPTVDGTTYEYHLCHDIAQKLRDTGLFFFVYDDHDNRRYYNVINYYIRLTGDRDHLVIADYLQDSRRMVQEQVFKKIMYHACQQKERVCLFVNVTRDVCAGRWNYTSSYVVEETDCPGWVNHTEPSGCALQECFDQCDAQWPWNEEAHDCDCSVGLRRRGELPKEHLFYCPRLKQCNRCKHVPLEDKFFGTPGKPFDRFLWQTKRKPFARTFSYEEDADNNADDEQQQKKTEMPVWIIFCIGFGLMLLFAVAAFMALRKRDNDGYTMFNRYKRRYYEFRSRRRYDKRQPLTYRDLGPQQSGQTTPKSKSKTHQSGGTGSRQTRGNRSNPSRESRNNRSRGSGNRR